jgi:cyclic beta-1,2-glucan synthetase
LRTHLLSNGSYSVMLTAAGSGYSRWRDIALTRWREDPTCDPWGSYVFLRDVFGGNVWSAGYQPIGHKCASYEAAFSEGGARFSRQDDSIETVMQVLVSSEDDAEARQLSLSNHGSSAREIEVTSYVEVVLSQPAADMAHPAFSKMFVQTEFNQERGALLATRRPRDPGPQLWMVHFSSSPVQSLGGLQFETDRARFIGRGHDLRHAASIMDSRPLSMSVGTVLDPVLALRRRVRIEPGDTVQIAFWTGIAQSRAQALSLAEKCGADAAFQRTLALCSAKTEFRLREQGLSAADTQQFQQIAARVLYSDAVLRAPRALLEKNQLGQATLWTHGVSGDLPIVLVIVNTDADLVVIKQLLRAQRYWQSKCLAVDLLILNAAPPAMTAAIQMRLEAAVGDWQKMRDAQNNARGAAILLRADAMTPEHRDFLRIAARAIFGAGVSLAEQLSAAAELTTTARLRGRPSGAQQRTTAPQLVPTLEYFNGLGGFDAAAREYRVVLDAAQWTPAPWVNVIANPQFGFLSSADGCGSTWSLNAQQNQITPWSNDPVSDTPSEAIYLRDEDSGDLWSATALPIREPSSVYVVCHGFGYTRCEHTAHGIALTLTQFVPLSDSIKISRLKLVNASDQVRRLSITHYVDWVLGNQNNRAAPFIVTAIDPKSGALLARNPWTADFQTRVAFMDLSGRQQSYTADRGEFIGRYGSLAEPQALLGAEPLRMRVGGGLDPCGAMQTKISLNPGETIELTALLGEEASSAEAVALIERYRGADLDAVLKEVGDFWDRTLGMLQVKTPDRSLDIMTNGWLLYQTLACRVWGRTAFYQSSGAYGFRDQLQDVMALCYSAPALTREHILRAAARQFDEGDVQHWWLPTSGQGIKTRISDDRIWLSFVVAHYLEVTADAGVLDEPVPFLSGGPLAADAMENFSAPKSGNPASLFEHCVRALDSSMSLGTHGLPLFGTGDWNDGMNRVGIAGRGESVWLGWFLYAALMRFAPIAEARGAVEKAAGWREHAVALQRAIEREAWDGDWYRRGYYDDGTPLGSVLSDECKIDSVAQTWAVISGAAERGRALRAMSAVDSHLVRRSDALIELFTPAFDHTAKDPGYIKAYPPGLRENGGQYTHAATWTTLAYALLGDGDRAAEAFSILNPINHASTRAAVERYKVEPYVVCADVYSVPPHVGRGGWTWYSGSAGWMYRTAVEGILGIKLRGATLIVDPCIPRAWPEFEFTYQYLRSRYRITVKNPQGVSRGIAAATLDGKSLGGEVCAIGLIDDGGDHYGEITLGNR